MNRLVVYNGYEIDRISDLETWFRNHHTDNHTLILHFSTTGE